MSDSIKKVDFFGRVIGLDEFYFISYSDQKAEISKADKEGKYAKYFQIQEWPETILKWKAIAELPPGYNPNWIKITGRMLIEWSERGYIPQFDKFFRLTHQLTMCPVSGIEILMQNSLLK